MTGYGRATWEGSLGQITVELSSLNRRHFDVRTSMPPHLLFLECDVRRLLRYRIERGAITLTLRVQYTDASSLQLEPNRPLLTSLNQAIDVVASALGIAREAAIPMIAKHGGDMIVDQRLEDVEGHHDLILKATEKALEALLKVKRAEGEAIAADILQRLQRLRELRSALAKRVPIVLEAHRNRMRCELAAIGAKGDLADVVAGLDKGDIAEELTRVAHHLREFEQAVGQETRVSGKALEFRLQELLREFNTIGSKSGDIAIADHVVEAKSQLEKIREQLQNVE